MMLVDYTMVLDRPSVSVECPTQQGVESVVEVTPASGVTSDGSSDPSLQLLLLRELHHHTKISNFREANNFLRFLFKTVGN
jgi:hypothetical protein